MNYFDNRIEQVILNEEVKEIPRDSLDTTIFQFFDDGRQPILQNGIKAQILTDIQTLSNIVSVEDIFIIGDVLSYHASKDCLIDVIIEVDAEQLDNVSTAEVLYIIHRISGRLATNTTHPLNYLVIPGIFEKESIRSIYDVVNERWVKMEDPINPEINSFVIKFIQTLQSINITTGEISYNLISIEDLKGLGEDNLKKLLFYIQQKYIELKEKLKYASTIQDNRILKQLVIDETLDQNDILYFSHRYKLNENIILKLFERFYYNKFIEKIDTLLDTTDFNISSLIKRDRIGREFYKAQ